MLWDDRRPSSTTSSFANSLSLTWPSRTAATSSGPAGALAFAARHPEQVNRIVLFGGSSRTWDVMSSKQTQALLSLIEQDWNVFADTAAHQWLGWAAGEAGRATADAFRGAVTPQVARATMQAASATDVTQDLARVKAPTLVLHRRGVPQIPIEVSRSLATQLPRGRLVVLEGAQPHLFLEAPEQVVQMLVDFFSEGIEPSETMPRPGGAEVPAGQSPAPTSDLSRRELDVIRLLAAGESNGQIARRLGLSTHTIERHVANI